MKSILSCGFWCVFWSKGTGMAMFRALLILAADQQGGNGMLEDQLFLGVCFKHDGIFIERADVAGNFRAIQ